MRRVLTLLLVAGPALGLVASAQTPATPAALRQQLAGQTGLARARTLAALTDALRQDQPREAIAYGSEALAIFAAHPDPAAEVRTRNEMAWAYMTLSDYPHAIAFAEQGRALAERTHDAAGRARAINNLGVIAQRRGDGLQAVDSFTQSLTIYRELGRDSEISTALNNLGFVYSTLLADYETGLAHHVEALAVRERLGDRSAIALSLNNIGIIYHRIGDLDRALSYFERSLAIRRSLGGDNRIAGTLHNLGDVYFDKRDYVTALSYHTQSLELRRAIGDRAGIAASLRNLGLAHHALGHEEEARRDANEALAMASTAGDRTIEAQAHLALSKVDADGGQARRAIGHARAALRIAEQLGAQELLRQSWEQLSASQERAGQYAEALASLREYQAVRDRIFDVDRTRRVELLERRYQAEKREVEIAQLRARQANDALLLQQRQNQRNAAIGGAAFLGLLGFLLYRRRVESARIAEGLSMTDTLTGLRNRRFVLQTIEADTIAALRKHRMASPGRPEDGDVVFMMIDIDNFKSINDELGHEAGDRVLVQMADVLRRACRASDTIARWGGEEFLVIWRFTTRATAPAAAERIRAAFERQEFYAGQGRTLHRTCSIGFAPYPLLPDRPDEASWEQVLALADEALYQAKRSGRNTWVAADPSQLAAIATKPARGRS